MRRVEYAKSKTRRAHADRSSQRFCPPYVTPPSPIIDNSARGIVAGCPCHPAAGVRTRAAVIEPLQRRAVVGVSERWSCPEQLVETQCAMEYVAARQPEHLFEIERGQGLAAKNAPLESRREALDRLDHQIGYPFAMIVP